MGNEIILKSKNFIKILEEEYKIKFAYIFGSFARGEENNNSDVDIAIMFENKYSVMEDMLIRGKYIDIGRNIFKREVDIVSLNNAGLILKYQIIKDGILIKTRSDVAEYESLIQREYFDFKYYSDLYDNSIIESIKNRTYFRGQ